MPDVSAGTKRDGPSGTKGEKRAALFGKPGRSGALGPLLALGESRQDIIGGE
jgi:hypothetical protein